MKITQNDNVKTVLTYIRNELNYATKHATSHTHNSTTQLLNY